MEQAAKDWCETIRASQVIPVYPLTEDIQPGDIFLVQVPVDQQQKLFNRKGFLPLDNHLDRLNPLNYTNFYSHSFLATTSTDTLPAAWMRPGNSITNSWVAAPNAAFPSYSFSVQQGAGINLAFPVEGVPVGLSLLGSDSADGTVIIKNAHTLGVDTISLYDALKNWAVRNADFLSNFGSATGTNYLRVISRIYTVGYVDVSLRDSSSRSGGLDVGAGRPVNLLTPQLMQGTNADSATIQSNFVNGNNLLQQMVTNALAIKDSAGNLIPGGSLRLTAASGRTISMQETFEPPLTIGYLGFDCSIMPGGELGPPIPSFAVLSTNLNLKPTIKPRTQHLLDYAIYQAIRDQTTGDLRAKAVVDNLDALVNLVPPTFSTYGVDDSSKTNFILACALKPTEVLRNPNRLGFQLFLSYKTMVESSITNLVRALSHPQFTLRHRAGPPDETVTSASPQRQALAEQLAYYKFIFNSIAADPAYNKAMSAAYAYERDKLQ